METQTERAWKFLESLPTNILIFVIMRVTYDLGSGSGSWFKIAVDPRNSYEAASRYEILFYSKKIWKYPKNQNYYKIF